jgi:ABC-type multidrug transport system fused ATPase/permease subunit
MQNGAIIDRGTYAELYENSALFQELANKTEEQ